jgi:hypothetical protein
MAKLKELKKPAIYVGINSKDRFTLRYTLPDGTKKVKATGFPVEPELSKLRRQNKHEKKDWWKKSKYAPNLRMLIADLQRTREDDIHMLLQEVAGLSYSRTNIMIEPSEWLGPSGKVHRKNLLESVGNTITNELENEDQTEITINFRLPNHKEAERLKKKQYDRILDVISRTDKALFVEFAAMVLEAQGIFLSDLPISDSSKRVLKRYLDAAMWRRMDYMQDHDNVAGLKHIYTKEGIPRMVPIDDTSEDWTDYFRQRQLGKVKQKSNKPEPSKAQKKPKKGTRRR